MQVEIDAINQEHQRQKEIRAEQEKLAEQKVVEYMKKKAEREAEYEAEQERIRKEKEKEVARLRALQERARDHQAEQDALRAKRNQVCMFLLSSVFMNIVIISNQERCFFSLYVHMKAIETCIKIFHFAANKTIRTNFLHGLLEGQMPLFVLSRIRKSRVD